jgi:hypothetical protein
MGRLFFRAWNAKTVWRAGIFPRITGATSDVSRMQPHGARIDSDEAATPAGRQRIERAAVACRPDRAS